MSQTKPKGKTVVVSEKAHYLMKQAVLDSKEVSTIRQHINIINGLDKSE